MAAEIDNRKQQIPDFRRRFLALTKLEGGLDLVGLLANLGKDGKRIVPVKTDFAGLLLKLECTGQGREADRNSGKRALVAAFVHAGTGLVGLLLLLDPVPLGVHGFGREATQVSEYVRMTANELFRDCLDDITEFKSGLLLSHAGME